MFNIAAHRLYNQQISHPHFQKPAEVVAWLGAVQAQEYALAKWAIGLRMQTTTDEVIEAAFNKGEILRTHLMRPTWHFVTPTDIHWLLELTAPRVHQVNGTMYRKLELDDGLLHCGADLIANALEGGKHLTRAELGDILVQNGIDATNGMRLGYIVHYAELEGIVCSGARRGKQHTYALLTERAPQAKSLKRDEALAELTKRFFISHGPAMVKDFMWWSGLTTADAKIGLEMNKGQLMQEVIDGKSYWLSPSSSTLPAVKNTAPAALLLPPYDEYGIAYKDHSGILAPQFTEQANKTIFGGAIVIDGQVLGYWRRTVSKSVVNIELTPFRSFTTAEGEAVTAAAQRFGKFLGMPVMLAK